MNRIAARLLMPSLLVAFTLCGCSAKRSAEPAQTAVQADQSEAIAQIEKLGGKVVIDGQSPDKPVISVDFNNSHVTDAALSHLAGLTKLRVLDLSWTEVTSAGLAHLKRLTKLQSLNLTSTKITDAGLVRLAALPALESLNLTGTQVTDAGLEYLKDLPKLRSLNLSTTNVTNAGTKELREALPRCAIFPQFAARELLEYTP